jgi:hypothetical protein
LGASGRVDDEFSSIYPFRAALDAGVYQRVGELSASSPAEERRRPFTYRVTASGRRSLVKAEQMGLLNPTELQVATAMAFPDGQPIAYNKRGTGRNELNSKL